MRVSEFFGKVAVQTNERLSCPISPVVAAGLRRNVSFLGQEECPQAQVHVQPNKASAEDRGIANTAATRLRSGVEHLRDGETRYRTALV